ncbi:MAG: hypothetical protein HYW49_09980 [Deltaproteobacteria bacterium]|nr:hypothetical protein [Deltaproteobacteria bacterium]
MFRNAAFLLLVISITACAGRSAKSVISPEGAFDEIMKFDRFAAIQLGATKSALVASFDSFKTEMSNPTTSEETYWILRDPRTGYQKAALTFDEHTQSLVGKIWIVREGEPERAQNVARARFTQATFVTRDLPSRNPHLLYGDRILTDEKSGITMEISKQTDEVSSIQWYDPSYRSPARDLGDQKSQYTF